MSDLKQAFRFYFMVLRSQLWALFPLAAGICLGLFSARQLAGYAVRMGAPLPAAEGFAFLMEGRSLFGLAGGVWACVFLCAGFDCRGINALLTRGYRRRWVFLAEYSWFLLGCMLCSLAAQLTAVLGAGLDCSGLGAAYLARSFALRLVLDIGFMSPPLLFAFGLRRTLPALCLSARCTASRSILATRPSMASGFMQQGLFPSGPSGLRRPLP